MLARIKAWVLRQILQAVVDDLHTELQAVSSGDVPVLVLDAESVPAKIAGPRAKR